MRKSPLLRRCYTVCLLVGCHVPWAFGADGFTLYKQNDVNLKFGGRIQAQYHAVDADPGADHDDLFWRRVTPDLVAGLGKHWLAKVQIELVSPIGRRVTLIKETYLQYRGGPGLKLNIGNAAFPYSREYLTSSEHNQFVERGATGIRSYGVPYRNLGVHLLGENGNQHLTYRISVAAATIRPDAGKITFDSPVAKGNDMNKGWIAGARLDYHPFGKLAFSQGDFDRKTKATVGIAGFAWHNTGNNTYTDSAGISRSKTRNDVDNVQAAEISAALRIQGWSADAEYNRISADAVDPGFSGGLYRNGHAVLRTYLVKAGYMLIAQRLELVAGYQGIDADTYTKTTRSVLAGANWFFRGHDLKLQTTWQHTNNIKGAPGKNQDELFAQLQYVF